jgi:cytochrome d ubiquinol oxidase subunit II
MASGPTAAGQRATIARAIGPVWEANHVWLIVAIVIVFTAFPRAFAAVSTYLHVPLLLMLIGIVLRGSAFVFRAYGPDDPRHERFWGRVFAMASTATPFFAGVIVGALTEGRLPASPQGSFAAVYLTPWLTPFSLSVGLFALVLFGYLAAVYLTLEAGDAQERAAFRTRAQASAGAVAVLAAVVLLLATPDVRNALIASAWAVPLYVATGASALAAFGFLGFQRYEFARLAAAAQVLFILWGWALAQYPYAIRPHLTLADAAAPPNVQVLLLRVLGVGAVVLIPSLWYLFGIFGPRGNQTRET